MEEGVALWPIFVPGPSFDTDRSPFALLASSVDRP
jgi:hypothetical protein